MVCCVASRCLSVNSTCIISSAFSEQKENNVENSENAPKDVITYNLLFSWSSRGKLHCTLYRKLYSILSFIYMMWVGVTQLIRGSQIRSIAE